MQIGCVNSDILQSIAVQLVVGEVQGVAHEGLFTHDGLLNLVGVEKLGSLHFSARYQGS